jgi:hypothetical protein
MANEEKDPKKTEKQEDTETALEILLRLDAKLRLLEKAYWSMDQAERMLVLETDELAISGYDVVRELRGDLQKLLDLVKKWVKEPHAPS